MRGKPVMGTSEKEGIMPKEYIRSMDHGRYVVLDGDESRTPHLMDNDAIKIGWSKESGSVSLCILDTEKDLDGFEARYINLNRDGLNSLIYHARRARDAAFGKDQ